MPTTFGGKDAADGGAIVLWSGLLSDIPSGWVLCDGNNGTPNLLGEFTKEVADSTTDPGASVGADSYSLSTSQLPAHSHSGSTSNDGGHNHSYGVQSDTYNGLDEPNTGNGSENGNTTSSDGYHSHSGTLDSAGGGSSIENRPAYHELAYIMKT